MYGEVLNVLNQIRIEETKARNIHHYWILSLVSNSNLDPGLYIYNHARTVLSLRVISAHKATRLIKNPWFTFVDCGLSRVAARTRRRACLNATGL
jgi:hypothetical protein